MNKKVGIIGYGYLGKAFARFFEDVFEVRLYDPAFKEYSDFSVLDDCDLAVICVPTPMREDGSCNTSLVESSVKKLKAPLIVIKSAVIPGTTDSLNDPRVCTSPEYMGESSYFTPYWKYPHPTEGKMHDFLVVGGLEPARSQVIDFFQKVMGPHPKILKMTALEAELVKYTENMWGATKVTFMNEMYEACKHFKADFDQVREGFLADSRVERNHTMVLEDKRGFSGKCYPKDLRAFILACEAGGYSPSLLKEVWNRNIDFVLASGKEKHGSPEWAEESSYFPLTSRPQKLE